MPESSTGNEAQREEEATVNSAEASAERWSDSQGDTEKPAAESPPADTPTDEKVENSGESLLDAIKKVSDESQEQSASSENEDDDGSDESGQTSSEDGEEDLGSEPTEEELQEYKPKTRKRIEGLLEERKNLSQQVEQYKQSDEQLQHLRSFVQEAGLSGAEVDQTFEIARLIKQDPTRALEQLRPIVDNLQAFAGERLPEDLQREVNSGTISEERAKELASTRNSQQFERQRAEERERREQEQRQQQQRQARQEQVGNAVSQWETDWSNNDPDYSSKQPFVKDRIVAKMQGKPPRNADEAVKLAEDARKEIDKEFKRLSPRRSEERPPRGTTTQPAAAPEPQSSMEAMKRAVGE